MEYQYLNFDISFTTQEFQKDLSDKVDFVDVYKWYVNMDGSESPLGDHSIMVRTKDIPQTLEDIETIVKKHNASIARFETMAEDISNYSPLFDKAA